VTDLAALTARLEKLEQEHAEVRQSRDEYQRLYMEMMERCRKLERGLLGQKAEKLPASEKQLSLSVLEAVLGHAEVIEEEHTEVEKHHRRKPTGRKPIPDHLPRVEFELIPLEVQREGLDAFERIGEEVTDVLERRPASLIVARIIKPKYVRKDRDRNGKTTVLIGSTPALPIPRCLGGPGMLADTIVRRRQDHMPLNRLQQMHDREGVDLARSTICGWHEQLVPVVQPLIAVMRQDAFEQPYLCTDATGVLVQAKEKCRTAHFWVLVAPGRSVLFEFTRKHDSAAVDEVLAGYEGYLVADAHAVYDHLYEDGRTVEVNCWAHCRRYFFKALSSEPEDAREALGLIGALFKIERSIATAPRKKRETIRTKHSKPIVDRFFSWCDAKSTTLLEGTPIYDGVRYARNQRQGLSRFLEDGRLPLHNNQSELNLRRQAVGRKNWLFIGSDDGAAANTTFTSLLASCRMHGIEPWSYLRDLLCLIPTWPIHRLLELAPMNWKATRASGEAVQVLDANPYRAVTMLENLGG